jgi:hypothetical protein
VTLAVRLDGTSDLGLADILGLASMFPDVTFYDYSKSPYRFRRDRRDQLPNRHLTFSASERPESRHVAAQALVNGHGVAAIVDRMPKTGGEWASLRAQVTGGEGSRPVTGIDGDETDARFLDGRGALVALSVKGGPRVRQLLGAMVFEV